MGHDDGMTEPETVFEPHPGWWQALRQQRPIADYGPYGGGSNPLHLGHSDPVGEAAPPVPSFIGTHNLSTRKAALIVHSFDSWHRELREFGKSLPALENRSWHVEAFDRHIGYLGLYRQSRVTGLWFQGKHSLHMAGNP